MPRSHTQDSTTAEKMQIEMFPAHCFPQNCPLSLARLAQGNYQSVFFCGLFSFLTLGAAPINSARNKLLWLTRKRKKQQHSCLVRKKLSCMCAFSQNPNRMKTPYFSPSHSSTCETRYRWGCPLTPGFFLPLIFFLHEAQG